MTNGAAPVLVDTQRGPSARGGCSEQIGVDGHLLPRPAQRDDPWGRALGAGGRPRHPLAEPRVRLDQPLAAVED